MKRAICKGCGVNFIRAEAGNRHYCSSSCKLKFPKAKKCKPQCLLEHLFVREVIFVDGSKHAQQVCKCCRSTSYIQQMAGVKAHEESLEFEIEKQAKQRAQNYGDGFYSSKAWVKLRYLAFVKNGKACALCGHSGGVLHVDHIKPRSKYPRLELELNNLQILCHDCNMGKGAWDETDWRNKN